MHVEKTISYFGLNEKNDIKAINELQIDTVEI